MGDSAILTVRVAGRTKDQRGAPAGRMRQRGDISAAEAIAAHVERELAIVEGIERGRADVRESRIVPHDDVVCEAQAIVAAARAGR